MLSLCMCVLVPTEQLTPAVLTLLEMHALANKIPLLRNTHCYDLCCRTAWCCHWPGTESEGEWEYRE